MIIQHIFLAILSLYLFVIILFLIGIFKKETFRSNKNCPSVSVIVAVRNGEHSLPGLLNILSRQNYGGSLEFIIVDDESNDATASIVSQAAKNDERIKFVSSAESISTGLSHKKRALDAGVSISKGEILLFTDVDCRMSEEWVASIVSYFTSSVDYVIGYTQTKSDGSMVSIFQKMDLTMLMACTQGITNLGIAWASSGQNQAYRRRIFHDSNGYSHLKDQLQGDDSLFLQIAKKYANANVVFASDPKSYVTGRTETSWLKFINQRIRWAGDTVSMLKYNRIFFSYLLVVFLTNLFTLSSFVLYGIEFFLLLITLKFCFEYILFWGFIKQRKNSSSILAFFLWFVINIPYIVAMGVMSVFGSRSSWHGRAA
ncbi:MAG: glycosyltransferase [Fidelibacterota bacterium]